LNEIKKELRLTGKGHNTILEIIDPLKHMQAITAVVRDHVPENGGTCERSINQVALKDL
jgi:hypothetical protein